MDMPTEHTVRVAHATADMGTARLQKACLSQEKA
jgi:hypothetical protein